MQCTFLVMGSFLSETNVTHSQTKFQKCGDFSNLSLRWETVDAWPVAGTRVNKIVSQCKFYLISMRQR